MPGYTNYMADEILQYSVAKAAPPSLSAVYVGLFTAIPSDSGGGTEVSGANYYRVATTGVTWNAPTNAPSGARLISNAATISFLASTSDWGIVVAFGVFDALTGGNLLWWDWLGAYYWQPFTCTQSSPGIVTQHAHGYANGDSVVVTAENGGTLPSGLAEGAVYTIANVTTDTFTIGVNTTTTGNGLIKKITPQTTPSNVSIYFPAGNLQKSLR